MALVDRLAPRTRRPLEEDDRALSVVAPGRVRVATVIARLEGGAGRLALRGATLVDAGRYEVTIVVGSGEALAREARAAGLEVVVIDDLCAPIHPRRDARALARLRDLFDDRGFDVVHTHCSKAGALGRLAASRAGVGAVLHTYHGFGFHPFQPLAVREAYVRVERALGRRTDLALCVGSGVAAEAVRRRIVDPARVMTIGVAAEGVLAPPLASDQEARRRARVALGLPDSARVVGAVGRLTPQKAPGDLVEAVAALRTPGVVGVWIGGGELADRVARAATRHRGLTFVLAGERDDVAALLPALDCFALPSLYEGLPTAIVEAMLCGVPVVATAVNAVPDVVVAGRTGLLVPPRRPDLLAGAIDHVLSSTAAAASFVAAAHDRVASRYTDAALREDLEAAYARVLGDDATAPTRALHVAHAGTRRERRAASR